MILIVTHRADITADYLILELQRRGTPYFRFNTDMFPTETTITVEIDGSFIIQTRNRKLDSRTVTAVWYRRVEPPGLNSVSPEHHGFVKGETRAFLDSLWKSLDAFWVSHPTDIQKAEGKLNQMAYARRKGIKTPTTLATNDATAARAFTATQSATVAKPFREKIIEPQGQEPRRIIFTTRVEKGEREFAGLQLAPVIFQEEIRKSYEVRVTAIGRRLFATALASQDNPESELDWRREDAGKLKHSPTHLPPAIEVFCLAMLEDFHLQFGAFDFAVTPEGEWVFFELNPNGQWAWIEPLTGQLLREALADLLEGPR